MRKINEGSYIAFPQKIDFAAGDSLDVLSRPVPTVYLMCALCEKTVQSYDTQESFENESLNVIVSCHGRKESRIIKRREAIAGSKLYFFEADAEAIRKVENEKRKLDNIFISKIMKYTGMQVEEVIELVEEGEETLEEIYKIAREEFFTNVRRVKAQAAGIGSQGGSSTQSSMSWIGARPKLSRAVPSPAPDKFFKEVEEKERKPEEAEIKKRHIDL